MISLLLNVSATMRLSIHIVVALAVAASILVGGAASSASEGPTTPVGHGGGDTGPSIAPTFFSARLDVDSLKAQFRGDQPLVFDLPTVGLLSLEVQLLNTTRGIKGYWDGGAGGKFVPVDTIAVTGRVTGDAGSEVHLLLGQWAVYGSIHTENMTFDINPAPLTPLGMGIHRIEVWAAPPPAINTFAAFTPLLGQEPATSASLTSSGVWYDAEDSYRNNHPDWYDRIESAFMYLPALWDDVNIDLYIDGVSALYLDVLTTDDCFDAVYEYGAFRTTNGLSGPDALQYWTSRNLEEDGVKSWCFGYAFPDSVHRTDGYRSSIMEGTNFCCDGYDANSARERGLVSGHEFGHIYGEASHPSDCSSTCNIMRSTSTDIAGNDFWFTAGSQTEIVNRFFHNT